MVGGIRPKKKKTLTVSLFTIRIADICIWGKIIFKFIKLFLGGFEMNIKGEREQDFIMEMKYFDFKF